MAIIYIPGPNNEMIPVAPPDTSSRFPINGDFAISASYAVTSSYTNVTVVSVVSASYANFAATASLLLGSIENAISASWAVLAGNALTAISASYALFAKTASYSLTSETSSYTVSSSYSRTSGTASYTITSATSSYALTASYVAGMSSTASYAIHSETAGTATYAIVAETASYVQISEVHLTGLNGSNGYINSMQTASITTATVIDSFTTSIGNSGKWFVSINDGASNFKTSEVTVIWDPTTNATNFTETTTNSIGLVPVSFSVNLSGGLVRLIANPSSGTWNIKMMRFLL